MTDAVVDSIKAAYLYLDAAMPKNERITRDAAMRAAQVHATLAVAAALQGLAAAQQAARTDGSVTP